MQQETPKRVAELTRVRKELQRRFMLLYRHFRLKKYGEPIPKPKADKGGDEIEDMFKEDTDMLEKIQSMLNKRFDMEAIAEAKRSDEVDEISDFGSDDGNANETGSTIVGSVRTKQEAREFVHEQV